jgi:hypothetical protein
MDVTTHAIFLPNNDPDAVPTICRDTLGFGVRNYWAEPRAASESLAALLPRA